MLSVASGPGRGRRVAPPDGVVPPAERRGARRGKARAMSAPSMFHRPHDSGLSFWGPGDRYTFLVTGAETGGAYFSMLAVVPPMGGPPPHTHRDEDETFYVLEGRPTFRLGDERVQAGPGDFVNIPRGMLHCFRNFTDEPVRMILTFTPAGIEHFFEETLERAYDLDRDPPDNIEEVGARYAEAAPRYGMEFFLDLPAAADREAMA
jgi:mannose-6-phosphate isomerase-like protein (cupin superfamily)